jgi:uncharacterized membrane protein
MRPLVALVLVAIVAFTVGATIAHAVGEDGSIVALAMFGAVAVGGTAVAVHDVLERRAERRRPRVFQPAEAPRRIRQGRP